VKCKCRELLKEVPGILLAHEREWERSNWQSYGVRLPDSFDQREVIRHAGINKSANFREPLLNSSLSENGRPLALRFAKANETVISSPQCDDTDIAYLSYTQGLYHMAGWLGLLAGRVGALRVRPKDRKIFDIR
jgi:hypothetical protein